MSSFQEKFEALNRSQRLVLWACNGGATKRQIAEKIFRPIKSVEGLLVRLKLDGFLIEGGKISTGGRPAPIYHSAQEFEHPGPRHKMRTEVGGWSDEEVKTLRENWPSLGIKGCRDLIKRTDSAIISKVGKLGMYRNWSNPKAKSEQRGHKFTQIVRSVSDAPPIDIRKLPANSVFDLAGAA